MNNINIEKIKQTLKNTKKLVLKRALPFALATSITVGIGTTNAKAANISFDDISIVYENNDEYVSKDNYESDYITDTQAKEVNKLIEKIDDKFVDLYSLMANGAFNFNHTNGKENSMARFIATINKIAYDVSKEFSDISSRQEEIIKKYTESKVSEAKLAYSDLLGVSVKSLNNYANENNCVYLSNNNNKLNIAVYSNKNNGDYRNVTFVDSKLSNKNTLVTVPQMEVVYKNNKPSFKMVYCSVIISKSNLDLYNQAIGDVDIFYSKLNNSLNKGNYKKNKNQNSNDIYLSVYGDTNLVCQTILTKYANYSDLQQPLNYYLKYKQDEFVSKVYNLNTMNYNNYVDYGLNNKPIRISENEDNIYYQLNNNIVSIDNNGYIKTSDLKSAVSVLTNVQIKASTGLNIYVDGKLYEPTDINGNVVEPFLYNGTTYLPARAISKLFNANIEWLNGSVYITSNKNDNTYYIDENGNKIYFNNYTEIPDTNKVPGNQLIEKTLTGRKGVKIYYNGNLFIPTDVNGNVVDVFIFNGTTYLPARAISNLFNAEINWNRNLNGVVINRNQYEIVRDEGDYYYVDDNGNNVYVPEDEIDFGNTIVNKPYYIDDNGNKVYIDEGDYQKTR